MKRQRQDSCRTLQFVRQISAELAIRNTYLNKQRNAVATGSSLQGDKHGHELKTTIWAVSGDAIMSDANSRHIQRSGRIDHISVGIDPRGDAGSSRRRSRVTRHLRGGQNNQRGKEKRKNHLLGEKSVSRAIEEGTFFLASCHSFVEKMTTSFRRVEEREAQKKRKRKKLFVVLLSSTSQNLCSFHSCSFLSTLP